MNCSHSGVTMLSIMWHVMIQAYALQFSAKRNWLVFARWWVVEVKFFHAKPIHILVPIRLNHTGIATVVGEVDMRSGEGVLLFLAQTCSFTSRNFNGLFLCVRLEITVVCCCSDLDCIIESNLLMALQLLVYREKKKDFSFVALDFLINLLLHISKAILCIGMSDTWNCTLMHAYIMYQCLYK